MSKKTMNFRKVLFIILFLAFLYPVSAFEGKSINYSFIFFPLLVCLLGGSLEKPPKLIFFMLTTYSLIFFIAIFYQIDFFDIADRRIISFLIFLSLFALTFIRIDSEMVAAFKIVIVIISVYFSAESFMKFLSLNAAFPIHFEAKGLVGTQRFGFIYIIGFWTMLFYRSYKTWHFVIKYLLLFLIVSGLFLTFSRGSVVSLMASVLFFTIYSMRKISYRLTVGSILKSASLVIVMIFVVYLVYYFIPLTFEFYQVRLFEHIVTGGAQSEWHNPDGSMGARLVTWSKILDFVLENPLTGSGYLGIWIIDYELGSAHSQYLDVFLRTGLIGFSFYCYLLYRLIKYLYSNERAIFFGFLGFLVYGFFHETSKESQGCFVFAFLLGMMISEYHQQNVAIEESA